MVSGDGPGSGCSDMAGLAGHFDGGLQVRQIGSSLAGPLIVSFGARLQTETIATRC
jgi:hypothetical protein